MSCHLSSDDLYKAMRGDIRILSAGVEELLEALVKLEEETWAPVPDDERFIRMRDIARAAIAKAEGGTNG